MKKFLKNWLTTLLGSVAGVPIILEGLDTSDWKLVLAGVGAMLVGLFARDANKSSETTGVEG